VTSGRVLAISLAAVSVAAAQNGGKGVALPPADPMRFLAEKKLALVIGINTYSECSRVDAAGIYRRSAPRRARHQGRDPRSPDERGMKTLPGGSWNSSPRSVRVSQRGTYDPGVRYVTVGLRCAGEAVF
jgi:hypothetical protein